MPVQTERRMRLPPDARSPGQARRMVLDALDAPELDALVDTAVLLTSELCENAVLHAGTEYEVELCVTDTELTVTVSDHGAGPLEVHLAQPRRRYGRAASHGRGLTMLQRLAAAWGTRHEADGTHRTWFTLLRTAAAPEAVPAPAAPVATGPVPSGSERTRWLLRLPAALVQSLEPAELVAELVRRLREVLDADSVTVEVDDGDGTGLHELARSGEPAPTGVLEVVLPTTAPLRGLLRVTGGGGEWPRESSELAELVAHRIAMAVESAWLRGVDQRRRAWMTYLAETSELLSQSLDVELAVAVVPQVVVPRLGQWCAVHLADPLGRLRLAALTHADEDALPELRAVLDPDGRPGPPAELRDRLADLLHDGAAGATARFALPTDGVAVALRARGRTLGTLVVGRPAGRPHTPEDVVLVGDIARRAGLAIHNAQSTAAHVDVSQALQQALLPRALPVAPGLDLAAQYLPATAGTEVGGDFYDVLTIDPAHWLVSIGDVCGKGARAAARTGLVRDVLRVLVRDGRTLSRAVELLNDVMMDADDPLQFCTLAAAQVSRPGPGEAPGFGVDLVLAGHLQPVLVRRDGTAGLVGAFGTAVGLVPTVSLTATRHHLGPGDTLLVYTDGVTERRRGREQFGSERLLAAAAAAAGQPAAQVVEAVRAAVERFSDRPRDDDIALLAVRALPA
ncbi:SpoIIE family protein phosphatase [Pseudonocardia broussonetiae]|uniref:SpoIIE family protein phosphatase n=1 Tax=Pseudonocardia broussonetiae TaxID=2736640 RepID=A0A6M6JLD1_9PSEU|nr:SpoIIE family protein phosphatase [Pseudonocardia broussonetiae]QJY48778.1 SpoIIE family protein phosphatase [Pseudonocardia broussonetiae]